MSQSSESSGLPESPGFEEISFIVNTSNQEQDLTDEIGDNSSFPSQQDKSSYSYEPGVVRKINKCGKYTLNSDVFEEKSRPVSVASIHDTQDEDGTDFPAGTDTKEDKFNRIHKPVLYLKSCPSPATTLNKKADIDPENLIDKLSLLDKIISDINETKLEPNSYQPEGGESASDAFADSETEIHCNPAFIDLSRENENIAHDRAGKKMKKKRRKKISRSESND